MPPFSVTRRLAGVMVCVLIVGGCSAAPEATSLNNQTATRAPRPVGAAAQVDAASSLRVMSFNLRTSTIFDLTNTWGLRKGVLVRAIRTFHPDLLGTQECRPQQARYLRDALDDYGFVGVGRNDGDDSGEMVAIFYRKATFARQDHGHFWLSTTPSDPGSQSWDTLLPRMVSWAKLKRRDTGESVYLFNTHFSAFGDQARRESARVLRQKIDTIAGAAPVIVTGDFNADEGSAPHNIMLDAGRDDAARLADTFRDVFPRRRDRLGTLHGFDGRANNDRIDWILASIVFEARSAAIKRYHDDGRYPSDHFPVTAVLHWPAVTADASEGGVGDGRL
jgi:endonuclease/exonuclease/phosphatase family metal-dependent hydrolase